MEKIEIYSKPHQIIEYLKGVYHADPRIIEESYPFTMEVIKIPHSVDDVTLGELVWDESTPPAELLAEDTIRENFFDLKWKTA